MRSVRVSGLIAYAFLTIGCGKEALTGRPADTPSTRVVPRTPADEFREGLARMAQHDRAHDWDAEACAETAGLFMRAAADVRRADTRASPRYNAALVHQRCGEHAEAKALLRPLLDADPAFYPARASLALYEAAEPGRLDHAIVELRRAVVDARFLSTQAHVALATLQMQRGSSAPDDERADDFARAKKSLYRALAVDDAYMPALNQLAILYLTQAKREGGGGVEGRKATASRLELAALVCSQAIRKNPRHAPIHNTLGLVDVELGNPSRAAAEFWALVSSASGQAGRRADDESAANHAAWRANPSAGGRAPRARTRAGASATGVDTVKMSEKLRQK